MYIYDNISLNSYKNEEYFKQICGENQNTRFMFSNFFWRSYFLWGNEEKYGTARQATDNNKIRRMRFAC